MVEPTARGNAIGDIGHFARVNFIEIGKQMLFQQLAMQGGHAVDGMATDHCQVRHAHPSAMAFIDNGDAAQQIGIPREMVIHRVQEFVVNFVNDFQMARQQAAKQID